MLYCIRCGQEIEGDYFYCPVCGDTIREDFRNGGNGGRLFQTGQPLEIKVADLREKLAEARHNEQIGWQSVGIAIIIVIALAVIRTQIANGNGLFVSAGFRTVDYTLAADTGLVILAAVLVMLGVTLSVYSRFQRTRLLKEFKDIKY